MNNKNKFFKIIINISLFIGYIIVLFMLWLSISEIILVFISDRITSNIMSIIIIITIKIVFVIVNKRQK